MREHLYFRDTLTLYSKNKKRANKIHMASCGVLQMMDWEVCVICGDGGGILKCPADSKQKNGADIYRNFLESFKGFQDCKSLPVPVQFSGEQSPEEFMAHKAKWHKSCHLKFAPSKLKIILGKKRNLESGQSEGGPRKSKRMSMGMAKQESCMFCTKITGTLHACATMKLDNDLRLMATELQDAELLARIAGGDLIAIEAKYHYNCLSAYKSKYRSMQRAEHDACSHEVEIIKAQSYADLFAYIEDNVETGNYIFRLAELYDMLQRLLTKRGVNIPTNKTRLKLRILDHFSDQCQEQSDGKSVLIIFNEGMKKILKDALPSLDYNSEALAMAKAVKILRREILS